MPERTECPRCGEDVISVEYLAPESQVPSKLLLNPDSQQGIAFPRGLPEDRQGIPFTFYTRHLATCAALAGPREVGASDVADEAAKVTPEQEGEKEE